MIWEWISRFADLLGIAAIVLPPVIGWLLSWIASPRDAPKPAPKSSPVSREQITFGSLFRETLTDWIIRPDVPLRDDVGRVVIGYVCLIGAIGSFVWGSWNPSSFELIRLAQSVLLILIVLFALWLVLLTARLFWKIRYMNRRMQDEDE